jgi:hypothetical protein
MSDHPIFSAARSSLRACAKMLDQLEDQIAAAHAVVGAADEQRAARERELADHQHTLANLTAKHQAECEARKKELAVQAAHLAERERVVEEKDQRATARLRDAENRAKDLSARLHGHAA